MGIKVSDKGHSLGVRFQSEGPLRALLNALTAAGDRQRKSTMAMIVAAMMRWASGVWILKSKRRLMVSEVV